MQGKKKEENAIRCRVVRSYQEFRRSAAILGEGDLVLGILPLTLQDQPILTVLLERGVRFFPSVTSQLMNGSKALQAAVLGEFMVPETVVIHRFSHLVEAMAMFERLGIKRVITKRNQGDCGRGINLWNSLEELFNMVTWAGNMDEHLYPFVLQPFIPDALDVRVVIVGDYVEAYERMNPCSFRNNIYFGAENAPYLLSGSQEEFCRKIMEKAGFPWAHIDLLLIESGEFFLSEIALNGGLKGAQISQPECNCLKEQLMQAEVEILMKSYANG